MTPDLFASILSVCLGVYCAASAVVHASKKTHWLGVTARLAAAVWCIGSGVIIGVRANAATPNISGIDHEMGIAGYVFNPTTTAQTLTVPAGAYHANFTVWGGPVCVSTSATPATTVNSDRWPEGLRIEKYNDRRLLLRMTFIKCASGDTPSVQVWFYRALRTGDAYP